MREAVLDVLGEVCGVILSCRAKSLIYVSFQEKYNFFFDKVGVPLNNTPYANLIVSLLT